MRVDLDVWQLSLEAWEPLIDIIEVIIVSLYVQMTSSLEEKFKSF